MRGVGAVEIVDRPRSDPVDISLSRIYLANFKHSNRVVPFLPCTRSKEILYDKISLGIWQVILCSGEGFDGGRLSCIYPANGGMGLISRLPPVPE